MKRIQAIFIATSLGALFAIGCDGGEKAGKDKTATKTDGDKAKPKADAADKKPDDKPATDKLADAAVDDPTDPNAPTEAKEPTEAEIIGALDKRVTRVAKLAEQIEAKPEDADQILEAAELDRDEFDALIYAIGADPDLSQQYQLARADK